MPLKTIGQKLEYLKKAIELGAYVKVSFHHLTKEQAKKLASELSEANGIPYVFTPEGPDDNINYFSMESADKFLNTTVFYRSNEGVEKDAI